MLLTGFRFCGMMMYKTTVTLVLVLTWSIKEIGKPHIYDFRMEGFVRTVMMNVLWFIIIYNYKFSWSEREQKKGREEEERKKLRYLKIALFKKKIARTFLKQYDIIRRILLFYNDVIYLNYASNFKLYIYAFTKYISQYFLRNQFLFI